MRCIEIIKGKLGVNAVLMININMRCIEICIYKHIGIFYN